MSRLRWVVHFDPKDQNFGTGTPNTPGYVKKQLRGAFETVATPREATSHPVRVVALFSGLALKLRYPEASVEVESFKP